MTLIDFISVANADETIHIVTQDNTVYFGTVRGAYDKFDADKMKNTKVTAIFSSFCGICVEISE